MANERRKAPDIWIYVSRFLAIFGWCLFIVAMVISHYAAPEENYGLLRYHNIEVRDTWLMPLTNQLYVVLWLSALSSYFCIVLDKFRARRKSDNKHFTAVLLLIITIAWVTYILINVNR
ncbi:hypothetical protein J7384_09270 [Endozoicomonas sp. G2_1]|uniref:hypothetical protein n=1 Tax=Endozoicomonas sp. G2_1 TaxID=2821091 RepID=UPI001ADA517E|nr:hypothetical protein [Endozoicomonas sp. G2_1]MBO9490553.1 hypothetical protein [Endozoicomonas sp. G2_1]